MFDLGVESPPPDVILPEIFRTVNSWSYGSSAFVAPSLGTQAAGMPEPADPTVVFVPPPDRVEVFDTPGPMEYILVPPAKYTKADPTGMKAMMKFLGFKDEYVQAGSAFLPGKPQAVVGGTPPSLTAASAQNGLPAPSATNAGPVGSGTGINRF